MGFVDDAAFAEELHLPHEPGQSITIRSLSWSEKQEAREAKFKKAVELAGQLMGIREALPQSDGTGDQPPEAMYDHEVVLVRGIIAWSYSRPITPSNIGMLDDQTKEFVLDKLLQRIELGSLTEKNAESPASALGRNGPRSLPVDAGQSG